MSGELYTPDDFGEESNAPIVVSCHGWSAPVMVEMRRTRYAEDLTAAGIAFLIFDYRGWGESPSSVLPARGAEGDVVEFAGVLDPFAWAVDIRHALDFVVGLAGIDTARIGLLGNSVGGGLVTHVASRDDRVKCVVSQMGVHDLRGNDDMAPGTGLPMWTRAEMLELAVNAAQTGILPQEFRIPDVFIRELGGEPGVPMTMAVHPDVRFWAPIDDAPHVRVPTLILDSGDEPNWDISEHGRAAGERIAAASDQPSEYRAIEGANHVRASYTQVGSDDAPESAMRHAGVAWFAKHL